jgi:hypothetical protein
MPDGRQDVVPMPLSDQEIRAFHESPRTFFGREEPKKEAENPLEFYDWMLGCYKDTPKGRLLELLAETGVPVSEVSSLPQLKLDEILSERWTESIVRSSGLGAKKKSGEPDGV